MSLTPGAWTTPFFSHTLVESKFFHLFKFRFTIRTLVWQVWFIGEWSTCRGVSFRNMAFWFAIVNYAGTRSWRDIVLKTVMGLTPIVVDDLLPKWNATLFQFCANSDKLEPLCVIHFALFRERKKNTRECVGNWCGSNQSKCVNRLLSIK